MSEKYNPMKSAEMSAEQNYNMIDGTLNNIRPPLTELPEKAAGQGKGVPAP